MKLFPLVAVLILTAGGLVVGCSSPSATGGSSMSITIGGSTGHTLPAGFVGLSLEANTLVNNQFAGKNLAAYLKTLGDSGVLRIGGNSSDKTLWTSTGEAPTAGSEGAITPDSLRAVANAIAGTGWQVILGVNLKDRQPARAADEAATAKQILGPALRAIEIGNEPNYYYPTHKPYGSYYADFDSYVAAIRKAVPGVGLAGPDAGHNHPAFVADFAQHEAADPSISLLTDHHYPLSACGGKHTTVPELLSTTSVANEKAAADSAVAAGAVDHVPALMDETNSVTCGGSKDVSNVFASALWSLDYGLLLAEHGITAADFHGGISGCGAYSPLCASQGGNLTAQPIYYGLLALSRIGTGDILSVDNVDSANVRAYAVKTSAGLSVVLDDVQDPHGNGATTMTVHLGHSYQQANETLLATSSSDGLSATSGVTLGGKQVGTDGGFPVPGETSLPVNGDTMSVTVQAGSAAIISLR